MARKIQVEIVTPERVKFNRPVDLLVAPGVQGSLGVLPGHIPLVTRLEVGEVRIYDGDKLLKFAVSGGYLEVTPEKATVLVEAAETPEEIDLNRALAAKQRAEERLKNLRLEQFDYIRAQASLQRALNRIRIASRTRDDIGE